MAKDVSTQEKFEATGKKVQKVGMWLTVLLTIPILLFVFLGVLGAVIGGVIFLVGMVALFKK